MDEKLEHEYAKLFERYGRFVAGLVEQGEITSDTISACCPWRSVCPDADAKQPEPVRDHLSEMSASLIALLEDAQKFGLTLIGRGIIPPRVRNRSCGVREVCPHAQSS